MLETHATSEEKLAFLREENGRLRAKLKEREEDCMLAANVGQSLLAQIGTLQEKIAVYEKNQNAAPITAVHEIPDLIGGQGSSCETSDLHIIHYGSALTPQKPKKPKKLSPTTINLPSGQEKSGQSLVADVDSALLKQIRDLQSQLASNQRRRNELQEALIQSEEKMSKMRKEYEKVSNKADSHAARAWNLELELKDLHQIKTELEDRLAKLEAQNVSLSKQLSDAKEAVESGRDQEQDLHHQISQYQIALEMEQKRNHELVSSLRKERSDLAHQLYSLSNESPIKKIVTKAVSTQTDAAMKIKMKDAGVMTISHHRSDSTLFDEEKKTLVLLKKIEKLAQENEDLRKAAHQKDMSDKQESENKIIIDSIFVGSLASSAPQVHSKISHEIAVQTDSFNPFELLEGTSQMLDLDTMSIGTAESEEYDRIFGLRQSINTENGHDSTTDQSNKLEYESGVESLTYTMIGSWFQKYNRHGKNPKLRYFWVNPYTRTIEWSSQPPSQSSGKAPKTASIESFMWKDPPLSSTRNYPPMQDNVLSIRTGSRTLILLPLTWDDHDQWVRGISFLLNRGSIQTADGIADKEDVVAELLSHHNEICTTTESISTSNASARTIENNAVGQKAPSDSPVPYRRTTLAGFPNTLNAQVSPLSRTTRARRFMDHDLRSRRSTISSHLQRKPSSAFVNTEIDTDTIEGFINTIPREVHTIVAKTPASTGPQMESLTTPRRSTLRRLSMFFQRTPKLVPERPKSDMSEVSERGDSQALGQGAGVTSENSLLISNDPGNEQKMMDTSVASTTRIRSCDDPTNPFETTSLSSAITDLVETEFNFDSEII